MSSQRFIIEMTKKAFIEERIKKADSLVPYVFNKKSSQWSPDEWKEFLKDTEKLYEEYLDNLKDIERCNKGEIKPWEVRDYEDPYDMYEIHGDENYEPEEEDDPDDY